MIEVDFWDLVGFAASLLIGFAGIIAAAGKIIVAQFRARINERFDALQASRDSDAQSITSLEREFLRFQADLPLHYVRREDYVVNQSLIEAKLDGLATKIDNVLLRAAASLTDRAISP